MHDFLQTTKSNCQKSYVFSNANTLLFSMMKTMREFKFIAFVLIFFYKLGIERKKLFWTQNLAMKTCGKFVENLSKFVKTFMITQNKGEWPTCLALTSVQGRTILKQIVKSNRLEPSYDFVYENKFLKIWDVGPWRSQAFFFFHSRTESARERCWKLRQNTAPRMEDCIWQSWQICEKKGLHEIIEIHFPLKSSHEMLMI